MRILYVAMDNAPYADRSHEVKVAEEFCRQGHDVLLVAERQPLYSSESPMPESMEFRMAPLNKPEPGLVKAIARTLPESFDAAFASSASGAPLLAAWRKEHPEAAAVKEHCVVSQVLDMPMWRLAAGKGFPWLAEWAPRFDALLEMDSLVVNTQQTAEDVVKAAPLFDRVEASLPPRSVVYYGIDTEVADAAPIAPLPRREVDPQAPPAWAVSVSRLVPYKGFDLAIAALSTLDEKERPGYTIVGEGEEARRLWDFANLARATVAMTGGVRDVDKFALIKGADVGLFLAFNPSIPAQFPMECVYAGHPCIVADMPINRERFDDHGVRYVDPFNTAEVAAVVRTEVEHASSKTWEKQVERHRAWILLNRSFASHARGVLSVLERAH